MPEGAASVRSMPLSTQRSAHRAMCLLSRAQNEAVSALPKIITTGFRAIQLIYFFTAGDDEVKCWQIRKGAKAPQVPCTQPPSPSLQSPKTVCMKGWWRAACTRTCTATGDLCLHVASAAKSTTGVHARRAMGASRLLWNGCGPRRSSRAPLLTGVAVAAAPQAAGAIHTDFERGFICAEVMAYDALKEQGTEAAVKAAGKYRQEV